MLRTPSIWVGAAATLTSAINFRALTACLLALCSTAIAQEQSSDAAPPELIDAYHQAVLDEHYVVVPLGQLPCDTWEAPNAAQGMCTRFAADAIEVTAADKVKGSWRLALSLDSWGREGTMRPVPEARRVVDGRRVEYHRGTITEWYVNDQRGIEQGFTIAAAPEGAEPEGVGPLRLALAIGGDLSAQLLPGQRGVHFTDGQGTRVVSYTGLRAWDAEGRELDAWLSLDGTRLSILVADAGATCPLTIDPWIWTEEAKLMASDVAVDDRFGGSVSISGDTAVVGARYDDDTGPDSGSAYVFVRSGTSWSQQAKLIASDGLGHDEFGHSVSISGDTAVIGAIGDDILAGIDAGSAYVFVRSGTSWSQQAKLIANDAAPSDRFGKSVSVSGDTAVVTAPWDSDAGTHSGSAYVFVRSGTSWNRQAKLTASDAAAIDELGYSVAISGDTIVVGADLDDDAGSTSGSAYVFVRSGTSWSQQTKLTASDAAAGDLFGNPVSISGNTAVVGATSDDDAGSASGSAYVFVRSGTSWSQQAKLTASDAAADDRFGYVSISGDTAVVGAVWDDDGGLDSGSAYVFVRSGTSWSQQAKLTASDAGAAAFFGRSVSISGPGDTVVVGAYGDREGGGINAGAAYVFRLTLSPWADLGNALAGTHGDPSLTGTGTLVGGDPVTFTLTNALENTSAALVIGLTAQSAPFKGGVMVPKPDFLILGLSTGPVGQIALGSTWPSGIPAGTTTYYQYWITDPAGPVGFSASNAISGTTP